MNEQSYVCMYVMSNADRVNVKEVVVRGAIESGEESLHEGCLRIYCEEESQADRLALAAAREGVARLYKVGTNE